MRWILVVVVLLGVTSSISHADEPLVQKYLHSGELARGQQVLESALEVTPDDDQLRFSLAALQLVRGVERLGQSLYQYGCLSDNTSAPFVRIPVPRNPDPSPITWADYCRFLDTFRADLATVEATLAGIKADEVNLPLKLADIRLDLMGNHRSSAKFSEILAKLMGRGFHLPAGNPDFLVRFDRGDVAWLRAYCHLLMAIVDFNLAFDGEDSFYLWADLQFAKPKRPFDGTPQERTRRQDDEMRVIKVKDPARLRHFRLHVLKVCELNRETWKYIRTETDDDHEWLPNPKQTGVLRMPVNDEMIDSWLGMVGEVEALFDGKKAIPRMVVAFLSQSKSKQGLNFKKVFDEPPETIEIERIAGEGFRDRYLDSTLPEVDNMAFVRVFSAFQNSLAVGYAAWFN